MPDVAYLELCFQLLQFSNILLYFPFFCETNIFCLQYVLSSISADSSISKLTFYGISKTPEADLDISVIKECRNGEM